MHHVVYYTANPVLSLNNYSFDISSQHFDGEQHFCVWGFWKLASLVSVCEACWFVDVLLLFLVMTSFATKWPPRWHVSQHSPAVQRDWVSVCVCPSVRVCVCTCMCLCVHMHVCVCVWTTETPLQTHILPRAAISHSAVNWKRKGNR